MHGDSLRSASPAHAVRANALHNRPLRALNLFEVHFAGMHRIKLIQSAIRCNALRRAALHCAWKIPSPRQLGLRSAPQVRPAHMSMHVTSLQFNLLSYQFNSRHATPLQLIRNSCTAITEHPITPCISCQFIKFHAHPFPIQAAAIHRAPLATHCIAMHPHAVCVHGQCIAMHCNAL